MLLMFQNARTYNAEGSEVYNDAVALETVFRAQPKPGQGQQHPTAVGGDQAPAGSKRRRPSDEKQEQSPAVMQKASMLPAKKAAVSAPSKPKSVMMLDAWTAVRNVVDKKDGRERAEIFVQLPTKEELPAYYDVISSPVDLRTVREKIDEGKYRRWDSFERDMLLVFANAQQFNVEGSQIYEDAVALEKVFKAQPAPDEGGAHTSDPSTDQGSAQPAKRKAAGARSSGSNAAEGKRRR